MPRKEPLRKKIASNNSDLGDRKSILDFFHNLFNSNNQTSETLVPDDLLEVIFPAWNKVIVPALVSSFGDVDTLYAIFYRSKNYKNRIIFEVWDPDYFDIKPSEVFEFDVNSEICVQLPINRTNAKVFSLNNWY